MKFVAFNGSPAAANSRTEVIVGAFFRGAQRAGAETEVKEQKFVVISNSGFLADQNFETMKVVFASCNPTLEIYRNCGMLLKSKDESVQAVVTKYLHIVEQAGYELASNGAVSAATAEALNMPLMSVPDYVKYIGM